MSLQPPKATIIFWMLKSNILFVLGEIKAYATSNLHCVVR